MGIRREVIKHSASIQISNTISLVQRKVWNILFANAFDELNEKDEFVIKLIDLREVLGYDKRNDEYLKTVLESLLDLKVEWNVLNKDKSQVWGAMVLLAEVQIINGKCIYGYAPNLRKKLFNFTMYARINLGIQNEFNSKHSLALYELFVDYFIKKNAYGETPFIKINKMRKLLGLDKEKFMKFKILNRNIIKKSINEINKKTDFFIKMINRKEDRKVEAVKFCIKKNSNDSNLELKNSNNFQKEKNILFLKEPEASNKSLFNMLVNEFEMSENKALSILKVTDKVYIQENLIVVRKMIKAGKVKNITAYTIKALNEDFRSLKINTKIEKNKNQKIDEEENKKMEELGNKIYKEFIDKNINKEIKVLLSQFDEEDWIAFKTWVNKKPLYAKRKTEEDYFKFNVYQSYFKQNNKLKNIDEKFIAFANQKGYKVKKKSNIIDKWIAFESL